MESHELLHLEAIYAILPIQYCAKLISFDETIYLQWGNLAVTTIPLQILT